MTTTGIPAVIAHLDFATPAVPCDYRTDDDCPHQATHRVTVAILDLLGQPCAHAANLLCNAHTVHVIGHLTECPNCPRLMRVETVEELR